MPKPIDFYTREKSKYKDELNRLKARLNRSSLIRISLFLLTIILAYLTFGNTIAFVSVILLGIITFLSLVVGHDRLLYKKKLTNYLLQINITEIEVLNGEYHSLESGREFINYQHHFSNDIDLFGKGSFFQYLNRTNTRSGKIRLADTLSNNNIDTIEEKQAAIQELAYQSKWRQQFMALAKMVAVEVKNETIIQWMRNYQKFLPSFIKYIPYVFSFISVTIIALSVSGLIPFSVLTIWFFIGLGITMKYFKKINQLYQDSSEIKSTFKQYHQLLNKIETIELRSNLLSVEQQKIRTQHKKASLIMMEFSKILDAFDQRNNMLFGVLGNGFLLWDIHQCYKIEQWIEQYHIPVEQWFDVIAYFDTQISLANYAYNHTNHSYPIINDNDKILNAKELGHPLIDEKSRINNDFKIKSNDFTIITGANMAGKSTFLRTISLTIVMANCGLPVCAKTMNYSPVKLISSMRTSDSLMNESSYFHAEITRLKFIVDQMKTEKYFIVLDEILKGTNSKDKAIGSRKFVEKLVRSGSTGIIATHDLSLCEIEKDYDQIHNKYFDALIKDGELSFDYLLREGICVNMNASFLLKKMEII